MFGKAFFPKTYFAGTFFPPIDGEGPIVPPSGGDTFVQWRRSFRR